MLSRLKLKEPNSQSSVLKVIGRLLVTIFWICVLIIGEIRRNTQVGATNRNADLKDNYEFELHGPRCGSGKGGVSKNRGGRLTTERPAPVLGLNKLLRTVL